MMDCAKVSINLVLSSETQPLLSPPVDSNSVVRKMATLVKCSLSPKHICQFSKPTIAIIVINLIVSTAFAALMNILMFLGYFFNGISMSVGLVYLLVAAISLFSPLSGFLADVCFSRYTVILVCFCLHFAAFLVYTVAGVLILTLGSGIWVTSQYNGGGIALCLLIFVGIAFIVFVFGFAGYRANIIQFGLDQLLEAPSSSLALFIHWIIWAEKFGTLVVQLLCAAILCNSFSQQHLYTPICGLLIALLFLFLCIILCFRRRWFYVEPKQLNPYKMVIKVLNYARKHKYPLQRRAFTYCDNEVPSRVDFSKERYGGPFTTEQVENVKTFFRILLVLIALGPVFVLEVSSSFFIFMVFGIHIGNHPSIVNQTCDSSLIILLKGSMNNLLGVLLYPLYIWFIFSVFRHCIPKIFIRLGLAISLSLLITFTVNGLVYAVSRITAQENYISSPDMITLVSILIALASAIFSPLFGFLADVHFGRCRVLSASICLILVACIIVCLIAILRLLVTAEVWSIHLYTRDVQPVAFGLGAVAVLLLLPGIASYQANFIPFGLDQLCDAPSVSLSLFIHWVVYADRLGTFVIQIISAIYECISTVETFDGIYILLFAVCLSITVMLVLIIVCLKQCQFNVENQRSNPYRMIYKVLVFTRKHRYPLRRSAFTYCDNEVPSRLDFAKKRFGGPFTTEQVEDVKTFFKILLVLLALGPIFVLEVPASFMVTTVFTIHVQDTLSSYFNHSCSARFVLLEKGLITSLISLILLPLFIWIIFSLLQRRLLSIFSRLWFAALVYLLGVASMLCIDLAGHIVHNREFPKGTSMCMFILHHHHGFHLKLHWSVLLVPYLLLGLGQPLTMAATLEFISAQSPSSMKGLLVGVFISVKAFFQLISGIVLTPFSWKPLWDSEHMREHPPVTNCGFGYLLFTCVVALIGLILLLVVARRYKYRERDDRPFDQRFAVDVYSRYLQ